MNQSTLLLAAHAVQCAYQDSAYSGLGAMPGGSTFQYYLNMNDLAGLPWNTPKVCGFVAESADTSLIAIRGTQGVEEWVQDARFAKVPWEHGQVAAGFASLLSTLTPLIFRSQRVLIAGHSLGGALATLLAAQIRDRNPSVDLQVCAFAPPNVGDAAFAEWYSANVPGGYRIVIPTDIVPHLPPTLWGFVNAGHSVVLPMLPSPLRAHDMATYIEGILALGGGDVEVAA